MGIHSNASARVADLEAELGQLADRSTPRLRSIRRRLSHDLRTAPPREVVAFANALVERGGDVHRFFAYELLAKHPGAVSSLTPAAVRRLGRGVSSWGAVDMFACFVAGPAWRERRIGTLEVKRWASSPDRWWRRAALVSTVPLNSRARGADGRGDAARTLAICRLLIADRDPMVYKALSWALRELAKRDPDRARAFIEEHDALLARSVVREVRSKLNTGRKT